MLLITGPPASGKTHEVLAPLRESLRRGSAEVCLLVPTATMADHIRHELARAGLLVRPRSVLTLHRFVEDYAAGFPQAPRPIVRHAIRRALELDPPEALEPAAGLPGLVGALEALIGELSLAGLAGHEFARMAPALAAAAPCAPAVAEIYERLEQELLERNLALRADRIRSAAVRIREKGLEGLRTVLVDGFFTFHRVELELLRAIADHAELQVTLPDWDGAQAAREALLGMGLEERRLPRALRKAKAEIVRAETMEDEIGEIARRILEEARRGRPFREMGVVVRSRSSYVPALRAALERLGIPARFYFGRPLVSQPAVERTLLLVDAALSGWDFKKTLAALRMAPASAALDRLEFGLRSRLPDAGLDTLRELDAGGRFSSLWERLAEFDRWCAEPAPPETWVQRLSGLPLVFPPPRYEDRTAYEIAELRRVEAQALRHYQAALEEAAGVFAPERKVALDEFWREARDAVEQAVVHTRDRRRSVVHVMDVYEARQWELPVVFVCGLVEGEFPRRHAANPLLPDEARRRLRHSGYYLPAAGDREREERFLFTLTCARASEKLTLSYHAANAKGDPVTPSSLLEEYRRSLGRDAAGDAPARPVRPEPERLRPAVQEAVIRAPELIGKLVPDDGALAPTAIETYLECPFRFFSQHVLRLEEPPLEPRRRLDNRVQGEIVHQVLAALAGGKELAPAFAEAFEEACRKERALRGYRTERIRRELLENLERWLEKGLLPAAREQMAEKKFELAIDGGPKISGRLDLLHVGEGGEALVLDYKYASGDRVRKYRKETEDAAGFRVQAGLYLLAAREALGREPAGMLFCALKGEPMVAGWYAGSRPELQHPHVVCEADALRAVAAIAVERARRVAAELRSGTIAPPEEEVDACRYCSFLSVCRREEAAGEAGGAGR